MVFKSDVRNARNHCSFQQVSGWSSRIGVRVGFQQVSVSRGNPSRRSPIDRRAERHRSLYEVAAVLIRSLEQTHNLII